MPRTVELPLPIKVDRLTRIVRIRGVDVYVHWTLIVIWAVILLNASSKPVLALVGLCCYTGVILIHECGHLVAAQRLHCTVFSIELYPIFGVCRFQVPWSRFDHCVIAWGGVLAQAVVAIPVTAWLITVGYSSLQPVNATLVLLGPFSLLVAATNLVPTGNRDGIVAWGLLPELFSRSRLQATEGKHYKSPP
jgi:hypothetical protein